MLASVDRKVWGVTCFFFKVTIVNTSRMVLWVSTCHLGMFVSAVTTSSKVLRGS